MSLQMDLPALNAFMAEYYAEVADDFRIEAVSENRLTLRLIASSRYKRPGGTVSGPSMFALADVAVYLAVLAMIGPVALAVTTNCSIDFLRKPAIDRDLIAQVQLVKLGRSLAVGEAHLFSEGEAQMVARAALTYSIPPDSRGVK